MCEIVVIVKRRANASTKEGEAIASGNQRNEFTHGRLHSCSLICACNSWMIRQFIDIATRAVYMLAPL